MSRFLAFVTTSTTELLATSFTFLLFGTSVEAKAQAFEKVGLAAALFPFFDLLLILCVLCEPVAIPMLFESRRQLEFNRKRFNRRRFLGLALASTGAYAGYRWLRDRPQPIAQREVHYVTPEDEFYSVSIYPGYRPCLEIEQWRLQFQGPQDRGFSLSYPELLRLDSRRVYKTFICIENGVGGEAIGNAEWTAAPLAPLLQELLPQNRQGLRVVFRALDGFYTSVPLATALDERAFIAFEMNDRPLPREHGYPARVLLPGKYGMKQAKWLESIEVTSEWVRGYWENQGWSYDCDIRMTSRIDSCLPAGDENYRLAGIALCGAQAVGQVEVSLDGGSSWQAVRLTSPALPDAWSSWEFLFRPRRRGEQLISTRVQDAAGRRQEESYSGNFPSGSTGLHRVLVQL